MKTMIRRHCLVLLLGTTLSTGLWVPALAGHDLFLKPASGYLRPDTPVDVQLVNGTFANSENTVTRDRFLDCRISGPDGQVAHPSTDQWRDEDTTSILNFRTGPPGNYAVGVSTRPRMIELSADDFNAYLKHDGVLDTLQAREDRGQSGLDARERYAKHVKTIVQVGEQTSPAWQQRFGYPVEFVPLQNPYSLSAGDTIEVVFLEDGRPVANQRVYASHEGFHGHDEQGNHIEAFQGRTDKDGKVRIPLGEPGRWYVRTILMKESADEGVDYESKWATLTFEIRPDRP